MASDDKQTRGRRSKIQLLPPDVKGQLDALLRDGRMTQQDILREVNALAKEIGVEPISSSGLNRYATRMESVGARIREAREVSEVWVSKLGTEPTGEVSKILLETVKTIAFDSVMKFSEMDEPMPPKLIKELAIGIERLEKATELNQKRELELRKQITQEAAEMAEKSMTNKGMTRDTIDTIKREILGLV